MAPATVVPILLSALPITLLYFICKSKKYQTTERKNCYIVDRNCWILKLLITVLMKILQFFFKWPMNKTLKT